MWIFTLWPFNLIFPKPLSFFDDVLTGHFGNMLFGDPGDRFGGAHAAGGRAWQVIERGLQMEEDRYRLQREEYDAQSGLRSASRDAALRRIQEYNDEAPLREAQRRAATKEIEEWEGQGTLRQARTAASERQLGRDEAEDVRAGEFAGELMDEARKAGGAEEQEGAAGRAMASTAEALDAGEQARQRSLRSLGVAQPGDPAATLGDRAASIARATSLAKAGTDAREMERAQGFSKRMSVAGQRRGFNPNPVMGSAPTGTRERAPVVNQAGAPGGGGVIAGASGILGAGNLFHGLANSENALDMYQRGATGRTLDDIGEAGGSFFGGGFRKGGPVRRLRYAGGGEVKGPGTPKSDSIPATIDGQPGAALSTDEWVIKAESAKKYGPRLMREVNEGTAIIVPTVSPRRLGRPQAKGA